MYLKEIGWDGLDWINLVTAGSCERVNGALGSLQMGNFLTSWETIRFSRRSLLHGAGRGNFMACFCLVRLSVHPRRPCLRCSYLCTATTHTHDAAICYIARRHVYQKKGNLQSKKRQNHKCYQQIVCKVLLTGYFWQSQVHASVLSGEVCDKNIREQLRLGNALLVCVPSKWAVMTLAQINQTNISRLVPSTARTLSSKALGTVGLFRQLGYRFPTVHRNAPPTYSTVNTLLFGTSQEACILKH